MRMALIHTHTHTQTPQTIPISFTQDTTRIEGEYRTVQTAKNAQTFITYLIHKMKHVIFYYYHHRLYCRSNEINITSRAHELPKNKQYNSTKSY